MARKIYHMRKCLKCLIAIVKSLKPMNKDGFSVKKLLKYWTVCSLNRSVSAVWQKRMFFVVNEPRRIFLIFTPTLPHYVIDWQMSYASVTN